MATEPSDVLYRLGDTNLRLADAADDLRGRTVIDSNGEEIGTVDDLVVDAARRAARFVRVAEGGVLGIGATKFLIPVEAVVRVTERRIRVDLDRDQVAAAPRYDPALLDKDYLTGLYDYYGYPPYWGREYGGPGYTHF